jgi:acetoacetate decarboxylase
MAYKYKKMNEQDVLQSLTKTNILLKIIPDVDYKTKIAQLVKYNLCDVNLKFAYEGPARLDLIPHINAPAAYLPVRKVLGGRHICADITLPYGEMYHDYLDPDTHQPEHIEGALNRSDILASPAMPIVAPSFKPATSHMDDREYLIIRYKTEKGLLQQYIPEEFFVNEDDEVIIQWVNTKATGIGDYSKVDIQVPVSDRLGNVYNYTLVTFVNSSASVTFGREIYGMPQKFAQPEFAVHRDTATGTLDYAQSRVATGTMQYHHTRLPVEHAIDFLKRSTINMKVIPGADGRTVVAQLVEVDFNNIQVKEAFEGPAALDLISHVHAPIADIPVKEIIGGYSIVCDVVMPQGRVIHDYLHGNQLNK